MSNAHLRRNRGARDVAADIRHQHGFTLIELLVAITILAVVAVLGWRGLDGIVRARIALTEQLEQTRGLQLAFAQLQSDCAHIVSSTIIPNRAPLAQNDGRLTLVRTVFSDDQPMRLQVVSYRLKSGVLTRRESSATRDLDELDMLWMAATNDADASQEVTLQTGVSAMTTRAWINDGGGWRNMNVITGQTAVSTSGGQLMLPSGLEVSLLLRGRDVSMTKVFLLGPV